MNEAGNGIWKYTTSFLAGVVLTVITAYFVAQKDTITRREFSEYQGRVDRSLLSHDDQIGKLVDLEQKNAMAISGLAEDWKLTHSTK